VLTLDLCVRSEKRRAESSHTKSSVVAQSTNPDISCPPSKVFTFSSVRYSGRAAVRTVNMAKASVGTCRNVAMDNVDAFGGTSSGGGTRHLAIVSRAPDQHHVNHIRRKKSI
jgi:hypothetical protein